MTIQLGKAVSILFSLKVARNDKLIASHQKNPLHFIVGEKKMILGLDNELIGLKPGDKKQVTLTPDNAYGYRDEELVVSIDRSKLAEHINVHKGLVLSRKTKSGRVLKGRVASFDSHVVMVDFNHPLAGQTLRFEAEIIDVKDAVAA
ncbi:hypothetical protein EH223_05630 [candidate division KSB1 bacterium]|nr:FKBP-type peptidyl-prolyl cis-trans isomerase [candidate division KSB1 bacterium]RQW05241.1 MAG: hypothetical protein EH223_05630 [candidate division KSB1 bacterium]